MADPKATLSLLIQQGKGLLARTNTNRGTAPGRDLTVRMGSSILASVFDEPALRSRTARTIGRAIVDSEVQKNAVLHENSYQSWSGQVRHFLETISVMTPSVTTRGNSSTLLRRWAVTTKPVGVGTRITRGLRYLEGLQHQDLAHNSDIPAKLRERLLEIAAERRRIAELRLLDIPSSAPGLDHLKFPNRAALHDRFKAYPEERTALEGGMDAYLGDGPDRYRHAVTGARVALEGMGVKVTRQTDWKQAIRNKTDRETGALFGATYKFFSSRGPHPGRTPTKGDAETALQQAIVLMNWLASHKHLFA